MDAYLAAAIGIIIFIMGIAISVLEYKLRQQRIFYEDKLEAQKAILDSRVKSSAAQRSTIKGQLAEQMYPLSERCPYLLSDMRFMGMPIDYIVFDGYTECKDAGQDYINKVVFIDIKTGNAQLSRHQKLIKDAIESGRISWETIRI